MPERLEPGQARGPAAPLRSRIQTGLTYTRGSTPPCHMACVAEASAWSACAVAWRGNDCGTARIPLTCLRLALPLSLRASAAILAGSDGYIGTIVDACSRFGSCAFGLACWAASISIVRLPVESIEDLPRLARACRFGHAEVPIGLQLGWRSSICLTRSRRSPKAPDR